MAELGEGGAGGAGPAAGAAPRGPDGRPDDRPPWAGGATDRGSAPAGGAQKIPPWRNPEVWNTPGGGRGPPRGGYGNGPYPAGGYDGGFG